MQQARQGQLDLDEILVNLDPAGDRLHHRDDPEIEVIAVPIVIERLDVSRHLGPDRGETVIDALIREFRIPSESNPSDWIALEKRLAESQKRYARRKTILTKQGHKIEYDEMDAPKSKPIPDEIDKVLAGHYGFTAEELDFILNYDIKYRLGRDTEQWED